MYTMANCTNEDWSETFLFSRYLILKPEYLNTQDEEYQLVKVIGGSGSSANSMGEEIEVQEVNNRGLKYKLYRYDSPILGLANTTTIREHKEKYTT